MVHGKKVFALTMVYGLWSIDYRPKNIAVALYHGLWTMDHGLYPPAKNEL